MRENRRTWISASGTVLAAAGGLWAGLGPAQTLAGPAELFWVRRLMLVAAVVAVVGAVLVSRGYVSRGSGTALVAGTLLVGTGSAGAGIVTVLGATLTYGAGCRPDWSALGDELRGAAP